MNSYFYVFYILLNMFIRVVVFDGNLVCDYWNECIVWVLIIYVVLFSLDEV